MASGCARSEFLRHVLRSRRLRASSASPASPPTWQTKHAVVGLTDTLRRELRDSGIGFTVVLPGRVRTELTDGVQQHWLAKSVGPEDVAAAIVNGVRRGKARVYVPRRVGVLTNIETVLPSRLADLATRVTGADRTVMTAALSPARQAYDSRVASSER